MKITQREKVVRHLAQNMGKWIPSYELVKASTEAGFTGLQADRRAFELSKVGYYDSPNARYIIESRRNGKYTEFRCKERQSLEFEKTKVLQIAQQSTVNLPSLESLPNNTDKQFYGTSFVPSAKELEADREKLNTHIESLQAGNEAWWNSIPDHKTI